jgi:lipopolysaccharide export system permease protein
MAANGIVWLKEGNQMISIDRQAGDHSYGGVRIYQLATDDAGRQQLWSLSQAERADISASQVWTLRNYVTSVLGSFPVVTQQAASLRLETPINPDFLSLAAVDPDSLPLRALLGYIRHLRANDLTARPWEVALWSRLARSLSTVVLCMLAVPFVLGPLRSSGAGLRIVLGIAIGVIYFLINRTLENSGVIYGMPPLVIAWAPLAALSVFTAIALARAR